jgi:hypothetical protein
VVDGVPVKLVRAKRLVAGFGPVAGVTLLSILLLVIGVLPFAHAIRAASLIGSAAAAALIPLVDVRFRRHGDLLEPGVLIGLAYLVLFPLRALVVLLDLDPLENPRVDLASFPEVRRTLAVAAIGILVGSLAYIAPLGARAGALVRLPRARLAEAPGLVLPVGLFAVGFVAQSMILANEHGDHFASVVAGRSSGVVSGASVLMVLGLALLTRRAVLTGEPKAMVALAAAVALGLAASLAGQFKEVAVLTLGAPLLVWTLTGSVKIDRRRVAVVALLLLVMFTAVSVWRHASTRVDSADPVDVVEAFPEQVAEYNWLTGGRRPFRPWTPVTESAVVVSHRLYGYDSLALAVIYTPSEVPFQHGGTLSNLASGFVPRIFWPSKPKVGIGYWFAETYWGTPPGVTQVPQSVTHIGELWIDFGWIGVVLGMAILGVWYRFAYAVLRPRESGTGAVLYAIFLLTTLPVDRDLPLVYVTLAQRLVFVALLFGAVALVGRYLERRRTA